RYVGKMFNDDWMRDRGFLEVKKPKAIDLIKNHKDKKLITVAPETPISDAVALMTKYNISQIPVMNGHEIVGSLSDNYVFSQLILNDALKQGVVSALMQKPFPVVDGNASLEDVSKQITRENSAVLVKDLGGSVHIITKHDIIEAISN
ncbi:MAG: CBS domain-containing protein, partial [Bacteroidia bacterium]